MNKKKVGNIFNKTNIFFLIFGVILGVLGLFIISQPYHKEFKVNQKNHIFTNPALNYNELKENLQNNRNINLSNEIKDYVLYKKSVGDITHLSVYFRNLNNGGWFGVNEQEKFSPASLMKLPILITYMKKSEKIPGFLEQEVIYKKNPNLTEYKQNIPPEEQLIEGQKYSIRKIMEYMIIYSDNQASSFLEQNLTLDEIMQTFTDVGIQFPEIKDGTFDNNLKVSDYAVFFRILFNSSYLNRDNSERILNLLSKIKFHDGINKGISDNILVSHKFGERGIIGANGREQKQLHDCGIVYYPNHPYTLCIMTRGYDWDKLKSVIGDVSKMVYQEVEDQYGDDPIDDENLKDNSDNRNN